MLLEEPLGATRPFNVIIDQCPEAVARLASAEQTAVIVRAARELGLRVHVQGSSHNRIGTLEGVLSIRLDGMTAVEIDTDTQVVRVEAGPRWLDLVPRRPSLASGPSPEINIDGCSLEGGLGWQARTRGLQANSVIAMEVVTTDGEQLRADAENHADLFWAPRGGSW
jgi:FAD/FMN-containing dehydrogenase